MHAAPLPCRLQTHLAWHRSALDRIGATEQDLWLRARPGISELRDDAHARHQHNTGQASMSTLLTPPPRLLSHREAESCCKLWGGPPAAPRGGRQDIWQAGAHRGARLFQTDRVLPE